MADLTIEANVEMKNSGVTANIGGSREEKTISAIAKCVKIVAGDDQITVEHAEKVCAILEILKGLISNESIQGESAE